MESMGTALMLLGGALERSCQTAERGRVRVHCVQEDGPSMHGTALHGDPPFCCSSQLSCLAPPCPQAKRWCEAGCSAAGDLGISISVERWSQRAADLAAARRAALRAGALRAAPGCVLR